MLGFTSSTQPTLAASTLKDIAKIAYDKNLVGENFWKYMYEGSQRTNRLVDEILDMKMNLTF